ncbi:ATP-binding cassette domain-containing protein [Candidatus Woesearchaeota archaeon]|nr:ATP-binding cassette domain-containing protein [Candidatus Woesearchaeota archaeon]
MDGYRHGAEEEQRTSIVATGLTKRYGPLVAVDNISLSVPAGVVFAFLGPNGAGKSTCIKMFTSLLQPTAGDITLEGIDVAKHPHRARKHFGIVFQDQSLDDELTAYENMEFHAVLYGVPKQERERRIDKALRVVDLEDRRKDLVKTFSGGMKRRLEIARSLVHHPNVLFLDEPTTGLDPQTRRNIWEHIKQLNRERGMTIFLTTHYMEEAEAIADIIAIIDHGRIVAQGTISELKRRTKTKTLEEAFLKLTGKDIREEQASSVDRMRMRRRMHP